MRSRAAALLATVVLAGGPVLGATARAQDPGRDSRTSGETDPGAAPEAVLAAPGWLSAAEIGLAEYDWELRTLDGRRFSLERYRGRVLVINAWATWCAPCVRELGSLERLADSMAGDDVAFLFVSPERPETVADFLGRYGFEIPVAVEDQRMPGAFGLEALPTTWVVDARGRIVLRHRGAADWDREAVRDFLRHLAAEP